MSQPYEQHKDPSLQFEVELHDDDAYEKEELGLPAETSPAVPSICGLPLKYVSCVLFSCIGWRHTSWRDTLADRPAI